MDVPPWTRPPAASESDQPASRASLGEDALAEELLASLRRLARSKMSSLPPGHTLQATALVHEAYVRLAETEQANLTPEEFLAYAARAMQDVVVENARRKASLRGGGAWRRTRSFELTAPHDASPEDLLALDEAMRGLAERWPRKAELVRMRFFAGLSEVESAEALGISVRTVRRDWQFARAWLVAELEDGTPEQGA